MTTIATIEELEALYGQPSQASLVKEVDRITPEYRAFIEASPFVALATVGPDGMDCSPRGDLADVVRIADDRTVMLPDRRGNNRTDSLRNIIRDGRVALLFLVPGSATAMRINGRAMISVDPGLCASFEMAGRAPRSVTVVTVDKVYFQCARAIKRADLWNPERRSLAEGLPTPGQMLARTSSGDIDGAAYDAEWPGRAEKTMW
ncbi:MAG: pyridoxamine 5'-phosphate oxidase family protein [Rhizobiaceae bacterium]|nr:pyridoxamine 5'-phosphate oxidase family protein [Rhizobiaceae bacterium]